MTFSSRLAIFCLVGHVLFLLAIPALEYQANAKTLTWIQDDLECAQNGGNLGCETDFGFMLFKGGIIYGIYALTIIISLFIFGILRRRRVSISYWRVISIILGLFTMLYLAFWVT